MAGKCSSTVENRANVAVVMVPLTAQGHLNQLLHLSRLISSHHIPVHYVGTSTHIRQATTRVHGWDPLAPSAAPASYLHFHEFPMPPHIQSPPPVPDATTKFPSQLMPAILAIQHLRQPLMDLIRDVAVANNKVVVIADSSMGLVVQDVPSVLHNAEVYRFRCVSAFCTYSYYWEAARKPVVGRPDAEILNFLPSAEGCFTPEFEEFLGNQRACWDVSSGDILNSSREIESPFLDLLGRVSKGFQWAIGPINPISLSSNTTGSENHHASLVWLDRQEKDSILFVSFGSTTSISEEQITELAIGLEQSMMKFIWVLREGDRVDFFEGGDSGRAVLPEGYEEKIGERGLVIQDWAPQLEIMGNPATGGFVSHCGWNSCMESISMGVPIAAWPMHSDQPRNATLLTKVLRIGFNLVDRARRNEVVSREEVAEGVKKLMASAEGGEMRKRAVMLSERVKASITTGGGRKEWESFIAHITK